MVNIIVTAALIYGFIFHFSEFKAEPHIFVLLLLLTVLNGWLAYVAIDGVLQP
jgi:hypothetical protein